jgi:hypothetical protein
VRLDKGKPTHRGGIEEGAREKTTGRERERELGKGNPFKVGDRPAVLINGK